MSLYTNYNSLYNYFEKLPDEILEFIISYLNFYYLLNLIKVSKKTFNNIESHIKFIDYRKNYAVSLIQLCWYKYKYSEYKLCCIKNGVKDPDFNYSMDNWLVFYSANENCELHSALYECYGKSWCTDASVKIHPITIKKNPFIIKDAEDNGLSPTDMILDVNDLIFLNSIKKALKIITKI
jgi:hypothetical protein